MSKDLPISSFDVLLQKLVTVLEVSSSGGELTPQARQALLQAVRSPRLYLKRIVLSANHADQRSQGCHYPSEIIDQRVTWGRTLSG